MPIDFFLGSLRAWLLWWHEAQEMELFFDSRVSWNKIFPSVTRSMVNGLSLGRSGMGIFFGMVNGYGLNVFGM